MAKSCNEVCTKGRSQANAQERIRAKASTKADCARADAMAVHAKADAMGKSTTRNLRREICNEESAMGNLQRGRVLRTIDGRRSNVG